MKTYTITIPDSHCVRYDMFDYPAGELQVRLREDQIEEIVSSDEIRVVVRPRTGDLYEKIPVMELILLTDSLQHLNYLGRMDMTLVLPYLPYSRADRRFVEGDCFGLKAFGKIIDSLCYDRVVTIDAHSRIAKKAIANLLDVDPFPLIRTVINDIQAQNIVILLPDEGAVSRYNLGGRKILHCTKDRDPKTGKLSGFTVPDKKKFGNADKVLIIDDICDGGGTFVGIADKLFQLQDWEIPLYLYVTHGIFSKGFKELKPAFTKIYASDSFGMDNRHKDNVIILPTQQLINDTLQVEVFNNEEKVR